MKKLIVIKRLIHKYIYLIKGLLLNKQLILNYSMGKVGSSSISRYLIKNNFLEWHIHRFSDISISRKKIKIL